MNAKVYGMVVDQAAALAEMDKVAGDVALRRKCLLFFKEAYDRDSSAEDTILGLLELGMDKEAVVPFVRAASKFLI